MAQRAPFNVILDAEIVVINHAVCEFGGRLEMYAAIVAIDCSV